MGLGLPGRFNHLPPNLTLLLRLPRNVTLQRTIPCTSHPEPRSNATRMLQSPATKCHTGAAPATQRQSPATTCHTGAAPATQGHTATYHSLHQPPRATLQLEVSRVQASQFHVHKRTRALRTQPCRNGTTTPSAKVPTLCTFKHASIYDHISFSGGRAKGLSKNLPCSFMCKSFKARGQTIR